MAAEYVAQRGNQIIHHRVGMSRRRRDAQPFRSLGHRRVVDRLDVDVVLVEQQVAAVDPWANEGSGAGTGWRSSRESAG